MSELTVVEQSLARILGVVAKSSLPLYKLELRQLAMNNYPENMNALENIVFPNLQQLLELARNPSEMFQVLRGDYSTKWFPEEVHVHPQLILNVDQVLDKIYDAFKKIDDEITLLQQKQARADLIADMFSVVKRDIGGGALALRHRIPRPHTGLGSPHRQFYHFHHRYAAVLVVIAAVEKKLRKFAPQKYSYPPEVVHVYTNTNT